MTDKRDLIKWCNKPGSRNDYSIYVEAAVLSKHAKKFVFLSRNNEFLSNSENFPNQFRKYFSELFGVSEFPKVVQPRDVFHLLQQGKL